MKTATILLLCCAALPARAQFIKKLLYVANDSNYVSMHDGDLTIRPYVGRNLNGFSIKDSRTGDKITFSPNAPLTAGLGLSYKIIGLNVGFALPGVNRYDQYGKSKFTDLSSHFYLRRYTVDVYYQKYTGQYVNGSSRISPGFNLGNSDYLSPHLTTSYTGVGLQYLVNPKRYSMEAPFSFVEYQIKSAGSPIVGVNLSRATASVDSGSLIPGAVQDDGFLRGYRFSESKIYSAAFDAGYAYTLVLWKHLFVAGAVSGGLGVNYTELQGDGASMDDNRTAYGLQLSTVLRAGIGYNSKRNFVGIQYVGYLASNSGPLSDMKQEYQIGRVNLTVARRFPMKKKLLWVY